MEKKKSIHNYDIPIYRFMDGVPIEKEDLCKYTITNPDILDIIARVEERMQKQYEAQMLAESNGDETEGKE